MSSSELPIRGLGSLNTGLVSISQDTRPFTDEEKTLTIAVLTSEVTGQVSELGKMHDSLAGLLEAVSIIKAENNTLTVQAITEIRRTQLELDQVKAGHDRLHLQFGEYISESKQSAALVASQLSEIRLHQQRTVWVRFKAWITRSRF